MGFTTRGKASAVLGLLLLATRVGAAEIDRRTGLIEGRGLEIVRLECTECHSARLITQTRGRREDWLGLLRWMQQSQDLRLFSPETETAILDYLESNYGVSDRQRRREPLSAHLLPPPAGPRSGSDSDSPSADPRR